MEVFGILACILVSKSLLETSERNVIVLFALQSYAE